MPIHWNSDTLLAIPQAPQIDSEEVDHIRLPDVCLDFHVYLSRIKARLNVKAAATIRECSARCSFRRNTYVSAKKDREKSKKEKTTGREAQGNHVVEPVTFCFLFPPHFATRARKTRHRVHVFRWVARKSVNAKVTGFVQSFTQALGGWIFRN